MPLNRRLTLIGPSGPELLHRTPVPGWDASHSGTRKSTNWVLYQGTALAVPKTAHKRDRGFSPCQVTHLVSRPFLPQLRVPHPPERSEGPAS